MRDPVSENPERRRQARLLSTFLLLMLAVFAATDLLSSLSQPGSVIPWYGYAFVLSALLLNRAGYYPPAAFLTLSMFPLATFGVVLGGADPRIVFSYLIIGVIASSIFLDRRSAIAFDVACFTFLLLTPLFIPTSVPSVRTIRGALVLVAIGSGLSILLMIHRDELERDRQEALRASEERLRLALDASHMGSWEGDAAGGFARWSERARTLLGLRPEAHGGDAGEYFRIIHRDDRAAVEEALAAAVSGQNTDFEWLHRVILADGGGGADGKERWIQVQGRSMGKPGAERRMNGTVLDVTERKSAEAERMALIGELEQKNDELERFTYTVSHDLKSPLITVRGFLGSIQQDVAEGRFDRLSHDVERILSATSRMQRLLDELLTLSRIGRLSNPPERVPFAELVGEASALVRGRLDAARVRVDVQEDLPAVFGDRSRLIQVLQNLFDNAAKFMGDQPNPRVLAGTRPSTSEGRPVFFVEDNGQGIDPSHLQKVLGLFEKLDAHTDGTGVGLAIVKRVVEVHGGKLWVESKGRGQGTTVCFTLPTRAPI